MKKELSVPLFLSAVIYIGLTFTAHAQDKAYDDLLKKITPKFSTGDLKSLLAKDQSTFIVRLKEPSNLRFSERLDDVAKFRATANLSKLNIRTFRNDPNISMFKDYSVLPMVAIRANKAGLLKIAALPDVVAIYENKKRYKNLQQSLPLINQPIVASQNHKGAGTSVAVLDTGVNYTNSAFGCTSLNTPSTCRVPYAQDFAPNDNSLDDNGHGTNVAAIVTGVAPSAKIIALDVFNGSSAFDADVISAMNWVIANKSTYNIVAMNLSLGDHSNNTTECSANNAYATPVSTAKSANIATVFSTGNDGSNNGVNSPSCTPGSVRVGAVYDANIGAHTTSGVCTDATTAADQVTCFSNSSALVTLLAPGSAMTAGGYTFHGTSQAAPHIAGAIAVMRAADVTPTATVDQTVSRLTSTGVNVTDIYNGIVKPRLNLAAAVNNAIGTQPTPVAPINGQTVTSSTPTLTWTAKAGTTTYVINAWGVNGQVIGNAVGANQANCSTSGATTCSYTFTNLPFPNGAATWNVRTDSPTTGPTSSTASFNVNVGTTSAQPTPITPINGQTVTSSTPTLTWTAKAGTTTYVINAWGVNGQVIGNAVGANQANCSTSGATTCSYTFTNLPFPNGAATWNVRTDSPTTGPTSSTASFNVN